jgi:hypothetical protein
VLVVGYSKYEIIKEQRMVKKLKVEVLTPAIINNRKSPTTPRTVIWVEVTLL